MQKNRRAETGRLEGKEKNGIAGARKETSAWKPAKEKKPAWPSEPAVVDPPISDETKRAANRSPAPNVLPWSLGVAMLHTDFPSMAKVTIRSSCPSSKDAPVTTTVEDDGFASVRAAATRRSAVSSFLPPSHSSS